MSRIAKSARKAGKQAAAEFAVSLAIDAGEHVHHVDHVGVKCRSGECAHLADERGYLPKPVMPEPYAEGWKP